jgi:hypothetical protein
MYSTSEILEEVDRRLQDAGHLILIQAYQNVGECSYARYYPEFRKLNAIRWGSKRVYYNYRDYRLILRIRETMLLMHSQPCLICSWCQSRVLPWMERHRV